MISTRRINNEGFPDSGTKRGMSVEGLIHVLGTDAAERLMYYWGGSRVSVPDMKDLNRLKLKKRVLRAYENGATASQVAERFGVSIRTAQRMRVAHTDIE